MVHVIRMLAVVSLNDGARRQSVCVSLVDNTHRFTMRMESTDQMSLVLSHQFGLKNRRRRRKMQQDGTGWNADSANRIRGKLGRNVASTQSVLEVTNPSRILHSKSPGEPTWKNYYSIVPHRVHLLTPLSL